MNRLRNIMFLSIVVFIFIGNGYFAYMIFATDDDRIQKIAVVLQSFGIISGLVFFIYAYFDGRIGRILEIREKIASRFDISQQSFRAYIDQIAENPELGLFNYLPVEKRYCPKEVEKGKAFVYGVLFIEQGLHRAKILHNVEFPNLDSWMLFGSRLSEQDGFREFFEYNSDRFGPLVARLFERIHDCEYKKRPDIDVDQLISSTEA